MRTREETITSMCYTYRHDYGLRKGEGEPPWTAGMTEQDAKMLWNTMAQIYDNDIAPFVEEYRKLTSGESVQIPKNHEQAALMLRIAQMFLEQNDLSNS